MLSLRKINPMARAVGTMGIVATMVGAVTFAALPSSTVALTNNTMSVASPHLKIDTQSTTLCDGAGDGPLQGMQVTGLAPGQTSTPFAFCLSNAGDGALALTVAVPTTFSGPVSPSDVTLDITCGTGSSHGTLDQYTGGTPLGVLGHAEHTSCTATLTLSASYSGSGGQSLTPFDIDFTGTSTTAVSTET